MKFEWDKDKEKGNIRKHAISFDEAATVFYDPLSATFADPDHSIEEVRLITVGYSSQGRLFVISHTERGDAIRIISARPATMSERKRHEN
ncbi:MAG: BrnT family toxin [Syntrophales bacterium]